MQILDKKLEYLNNFPEDDLITTRVFDRIQADQVNEYLKKKFPKITGVLQPVRHQVFISYSHKDIMWCEKILTVMNPIMEKNSFDWNKIPVDNTRFIQFIENFNINWIRNAKINKDGESITAINGLNSLYLELNDEKKIIKMFLNDGTSYEFNVKKENDELNIYNITFWTDRKELDVGVKWEEEIINNIISAKVAVLLVSKNFLNSEFIRKTELPALIDAQERGLKIFWIALEECKESSINQYQCANNPEKPLNSLLSTSAELDAEILKICKELTEISGLRKA